MVLPAGSLPDPVSDEPDCLAVLNTMIENWNQRRIQVAKKANINLPTALPTYATIDQTQTYDTGFDLAIQIALAIELAPMYKRTVPPDLLAAAKTAYEAVMPSVTVG
jgi:hypothetical protein